MKESRLALRIDEPLRVLFCAAEAAPLVKVGGLGDVAGSLPEALLSLPPEARQNRDLDIRVVIPYHPTIPRNKPDITFAGSFSVPHPDGPIQASAYLTHIGRTPVYLIDGELIPKSGGVYSQDTQKDGEKFTFFAFAVFELCRALNWQPHILHAHDWHAALSLHLLLQIRRLDPFFAETRSMLTVHNLPYMGAGTDQALRSFGVQENNDQRLPSWGRYQPLPMGLSAADWITTVSPTYGREIMTSEFGCGLENFLQQRAAVISGVLNGLDLDSANPATDAALVQRFEAKSIETRQANKTALQAEFGLDPDPDMPLIISIGRFDYQKGLDLAIGALSRLADVPWQAILLGSGDPAIEATARALETEMPERVRAAIRFDVGLSKRMYAGGDMLLIPSRYEPCGLTQMFAMRYGCLPVARSTGGLRDTILDDPDPHKSTGFLFEGANPDSLAAAIRRALAAYADRAGWRDRQLVGMRQDFSWQRSAETYLRLYRKLLENDPGQKEIV
jgi:starch synthase